MEINNQLSVCVIDGVIYYKCIHCDKKFKRKHNGVAHLKSKNKCGKNKKTLIKKCEYCGFEFKTRVCYTKHMRVFKGKCKNKHKSLEELFDVKEELKKVKNENDETKKKLDETKKKLDIAENKIAYLEQIIKNLKKKKKSKGKRKLTIT